jgi:hypothetical protein
MSSYVEITTAQMSKLEHDFPDTALFTNQHTVPSGVAQTFRASLPMDIAVYLVIAALVFVVWKISQIGLFEAGDDTGYWIGVVGGVMMLLLFSYPLRKHFKFARNWGQVKWWFLVHMVLGVGGPVLILLHSTFRVGSLNAAVALYSMLAVAASGVVGRFIYARVNRGLRGEQVSLHELRTRAGFQQNEVKSRLSFAPSVENRLSAFEADELEAKSGWLTYLRQGFLLPVQQWLIRRECTAELHPILKALGEQHQWTEKDLSRRQKHAQALVSEYLNAVTRVAQFTAYERLFSLWHVAHIPFVYLMFISAVVHVCAVHIY